MLSVFEFRSGPSLQERAIAEFEKIRTIYDDLSREIRRILEESFSCNSFKFQSITNRAKSRNSFAHKCNKMNSDGTFRYPSPLEQITDLAGVRVVVYTVDDLAYVGRFIEEHFSVRERRDLGEERSSQGSFGYKSIHYLLELSDGRLLLPEFSRYRGRICELQVRTVLQHAWAEIEHGVQYKNTAELSVTLKQRLVSLAGVLETADRELQAIRDEHHKLDKQDLPKSEG